MALTLVDPDVIRQSDFTTSPYPNFLGSNFLKTEAIEPLRRDFPPIEQTGFLTVDDIPLAGSFKTLIDELEGEELTEVLSQRFGRDLHPFPRLTTVRRLSQAKDGRIHTDGPSKVMTMLVYMNDAWSVGDGGRLRVLYDGEHFEPFAREVPPVMGTVFGFLRSDNSWHGHKPFAGERRVVQVAWVTDAAELDRKKSRNSLAKKLKSVFGFMH
jgi:SM-20-related protein